MIAAIVDGLCSNKNTKAILGGIDIPLLKRNIVPSLKQMFSTNEDWDHDAICNMITEKRNDLNFANGSLLNLVNLTKFLKIVGANAGLIGVDELHLLESADSYQVLLSRLRETSPEIRQFFGCSNPQKTKQGWMVPEFELHRFDGVDTSEHPVQILVGKACTCQWCIGCRLSTGQKLPWEKDGNTYRCPRCKAFKDFWTWQGERFWCPGDQQYTRVIKSESMHNPHLPADFFQGMEDNYDPILFRIMVKGESNLDLRDDYVCSKFKEEINVAEDEIPMDFDKDMYWGLDFNFSPECSTICQFEEINSKTFFCPKEEIVMYGPTDEDPYGGATAEDVAKAFVKRYKDKYQRTKIFIICDPHGFGGQTKRELSRPLKIEQVLLKAGFDCEIVSDKKQMPIRERVDALNDNLGNGLILINPGERNPDSGAYSENLHLIKSLAELKWKEGTNKTVLDNLGDKNAERSSKRNRVYCMTHPMDALSYVIYHLFSILNEVADTQGIIIADRVSIEQTSRGEVVKSYHESSSATVERDKDGNVFKESEITRINREMAERLQKDLDEINNASLGSFLRKKGNNFKLY